MNGRLQQPWPLRFADNGSMHRSSSAPPSRTGFTLVELMIALAIMAIIAALAWPSLQEAVQKSRRADGMAALANVMQAQERWRANNPAYQATLANLPGAQSGTSSDQHYAISLVDGTVNATAYTARATVINTSPQASDSRCQALQVAINGANITYRSVGGGGAVNALPDPCWVR
ncbi:MAG: type IV pilin protein [Aquabacterium sp.]|nr:type IV pilin protein [Aquabacterium sp.]